MIIKRTLRVPRSSVLRLGIAAASLLIAPSPAAAERLVTVGDAYVSHDESGRSWTIGNDGLALTVGFDKAGTFGILQLSPSGDTDSVLAPAADSYLRLDGEPLAVGTRSHGFTLRAADARPIGDWGVELALSFELEEPPSTVTRHYACYRGARAIELWTTITAADESIEAGDLGVFDIRPPRGTIRWVTGHLAPDEEGGSFTLRRRALGPGETLRFGAESRSSELTVPIFAVQTATEQVILGLMWSGSWSASFEALDERLSVAADLGAATTTVAGGRTLELPHGFVAISGPDDADASLVLSQLVSALRQGRAFPTLVIYNTWFGYGTEIDEELMRRQIEDVADLGAEVFVLDAGWYPPTFDADNPYVFESGLGSWRVDEERFPSGLRALGDYARQRRLLFGLWVEPGRMDLKLVGENGFDERWLAMRDGDLNPWSDDPPIAAQICLASTRAREWVFSQLTRLLDAVGPDYLKWDNNFLLNCNRPGHDHGHADANLQHHLAVYDLLSRLRQRYPALIIENVSGGGNRLDLGMIRLTDIGWMDDRSVPAARVRHNLQGLSAFLPPAYLFAFVMGNAEEPVHDAHDMDLYARSRMGATLGLAFRAVEMGERDDAELRDEIGIYKTFRHIVRGAHATLLTAQVAPAGSPEWDALQETSDGAEDAVIFVVAGTGAPERVVVRPKGLLPRAIYEVHSVDRGRLGEASGTDLMADGIEIVASPDSAAHILRLISRSR